MTRCNW